MSRGQQVEKGQGGGNNQAERGQGVHNPTPRRKRENS